MDASRRSLIRIAAVVAVATPAVVRSTSAAPITWMFTGPVDSTESPWTDILPLGTPATLTISWEPSTPQISPGCPPGSGLYPAVTEATLSVLNYSVPFGGRAIEVSAPNGNCSAHDFVWRSRDELRREQFEHQRHEHDHDRCEHHDHFRNHRWRWLDGRDRHG